MQKAFNRVNWKQKTSVREKERKENELEIYLLKRMHETIGASSKSLNDAEFTQLLREAIKKSDYAPYGRSKLMVIGEEKSGKTSLVSSLVGKDFAVTDSDSNDLNVFKVDAQSWKLTQQTDLINQMKLLIEKNEDLTQSSELIKSLNSEATKLSFNLWDFSGDTISGSLHHLFFTDLGFYILCFNCNKALNAESREQTLKYLRFWLFTKKTHAPKAPILIVGTHSDLLDSAQLFQVDTLISDEVLGSNNFNEISFKEFCFLPVDNINKKGIQDLKDLVVKTVKTQSHIKVPVSVAFFRIVELMAAAGIESVRLEDVQHIAKESGIPEEKTLEGLIFLSERGQITFFHKGHELIRRIIVLKPQWLIRAMSCIMFDPTQTKPKFDSKFNKAFRRFKKERVVSADFLNHLWEQSGFSQYERKYLLRVMLQNALLGEYNFDKVESYLVPVVNNFGIADQKESTKDYQGPFFVIDFSGNYDAKIIEDDGETYVRYRPTGFFERLVNLCVEHSARFSNSVQPSVGYQFAKLSFGVKVDFMLQVCNDNQSNPMWIKVACENSTSFENAQHLIRTIASMNKGIQADFFSDVNDASKLAYSLLLPSTKASGLVLAEYESIQEKYMAFKKSGDAEIVRPSKMLSKTVNVKEFHHWFESDALLMGKKKKKHAADVNVVSLIPKDSDYKPIARPLKKLPKDLKYHCFLSYKQDSAIDIVGKQHLILKSRGYRCWFDQDFKGTLNLKAMQNGVKSAMCYILFLSKGVFPSKYIEEEVKTAIKFKKPIIFLHHPRTGKADYVTFSNYIANAPEILKPYFDTVESIQLQRRYYLEEAVTKLVESRLREIYEELMN